MVDVPHFSFTTCELRFFSRQGSDYFCCFLIANGSVKENNGNGAGPAFIQAVRS